MRAQFVNENIRFERGQEPKDSMRIGDWTIKRALLDASKEIIPDENEWYHRDWWEEGGIPSQFKEEIGYKDNAEDFFSFDEDYYLENEVPEWVDYDEFQEDFIPDGPPKLVPNTRGWGIFKYQRGKLPDGTIVYHYVDGMGSGYITRKDWLSKHK